jgi:hypothetical protein
MNECTTVAAVRIEKVEWGKIPRSFGGRISALCTGHATMWTEPVKSHKIVSSSLCFLDAWTTG